MKHALLIVALLFSIALSAQVQPVLVKDINPSGNSIPNNFIQFQEKTFFVANDSTHGRELWVTDGTDAGTLLVKDINPGTASSGAYSLFSLNNRLFFLANDGTHGLELWVSDGTSAGTTLFMDINPGVLGSSLAIAWGEREAMQYNGKAYFSANDGINGTELWVTDGTVSGTALLKDLLPGAGSTTIYWSTTNAIYNNRLYFAANDSATGTAIRLYSTDGTSAGTQRVSNTAFSSIQSFGVFHNLLFFGGSAQAGGTGNELWVTDGTAAGTQLLKDISAGGTSSTVYDLTVMGNKIYFTASDPANGRELWASDGTTAGTQLVKDIRAGAGNSLSTGYVMQVYNNRLYFVANDGVNGAGLWSSDGTAAGTALVRDHSADPSDTGGVLFAPLIYNGKLIYQDYATGNGGWQLYSTDGTADSTRIVAPAIAPGANPLSLSGFHEVCNGTLYFAAAYTGIGNELYKLELAPATGMIQTRQQLAFRFYPNPAGEQITIVLPPSGSNRLNICITDVSGKIILRMDQVWQSTLLLPVGKLAAGNYLLLVTDGEHTGWQQLVKE